VTTIFVIGDSTAANKDLSKGSPERGWGMALQCYFDEAFIRVDNHAVNGRSSKSFIDEGRWDRLLSLIRQGDYVIIQSGHNDEKPQPDRHTDPGSTFDDNLARFVSETREKGGIPVVMNAVVRRNFNADTLVDTHGLYVVAPRHVASRMHCHFVDANRITHDLEQSMGVEGSKRLHMWYNPGEHPALPQGRQDNTHYNAFGAHQVARRLADALTIEIPMLKKYRKDDDPCKMP
jgi:pectinesterase